MAIEHFANDVGTTLASGIDNSTTSISVASSTGFPDTPFRARIDDELIRVTNVSGTTWTVERGAEGTSAAAHSSGAEVWHVLTAAALTQLATGWQHIQTVTLGSAAGSVSFQNLDTSIRRWRINAMILKDATDGMLYLRLNNDNGSNYKWGHTVSSGGYAATRGDGIGVSELQLTYGTGGGRNTDIEAGTWSEWEITVTKPVASAPARARWVGQWIEGGTADDDIVSLGSIGIWANTSDLISRIDLISEDGNFAAGTTVMLDGLVVT